MTLPWPTRVACAAAVGSALAIPVGAHAGTPAEVLSVVYDEHGPAHRILDDAHLQNVTWMVRQGPGRATPRHPPAAKVTTYDATDLTPRLLGRSATAMAALLRAGIADSPVSLVFIDEISAEFRGPDGVALRAAMEQLAREPSPVPGRTMADRVQMYVPSPGWMLQDPGGWGDAFAAMSLAGGVWLEAFRARGGRPHPWTDEEWATWPGAFADLFRRAGGDVGRAHLLIGGSGVARSFAWAHRGAACRLLRNGVGAYRVGDEAGVFAGYLRADLGAGGRPAPRCRPAARLSGPRAARTARVLALSNGAQVNAPTLAPHGALATGRAGVLRVRLGADPLGIAATLGVPPTRFWRAARPRVRVTGTGADTVAALRPGRTLRISVAPRVPGPLLVELLVDGAAVRGAVGPVDLLGSTRRWSTRLRPITRALVATPGHWNLAVPLRRPGSPVPGGTFLVR